MLFKLSSMSGRAVLALAWTLGACGRAPLLAPAGLDDDASVDTRPADKVSDDAGNSTCEPGRRILLEESPNARDLGGTPLAGTSVVACNTLYRGTALTSLSTQGCTEFAQLGIRTVIDLRTPGERATPPEAACVGEATRIVQAPLPIPYSVSPQDYVADLRATASMAQAFRVLGDPTAYPVYFHCVYGRDRTGVLAAAILLTLGASREDVMAEYRLSALAGVGAYPASLAAVLDEIESLGGVEAYLHSAGVTDREIAVLRARGLGP